MIVPLYAEEDNAEAATSSQTSPTLTLNVTNNTASLDLVVKDSDGTFATSPSASKAAFTVTTNNYTGYTLSIKSSSSNTNLTNASVAPNATLASIGNSVTAGTFDSATYNGKWGYIPSKYNSADNATTYYPSPTTTASTLDKTSAANSTANSYTIGVGARASYDAPSGTYSNTYVLTAVVNGFNYTISYNKGSTTDTVTGLPTTQSASATSTNYVTLRTTIPERNRYNFLGWCSTIPTTTNDSDSCPGDSYRTGENNATNPYFYFNKRVNNSNITLYAMWEKAGPCNPNGTTITEIGCMQDFSGDNYSRVVESMVAEQQYQLVDSRDEKTYTVAKVYIDKDHTKTRVFMTQNLDLDLDAGKTYTHSDTDLGWTAKDDTITWTPTNSTATLDTLSSSWNANFRTNPLSYDPGDVYYYTSGTTSFDTTYNSLSDCEAASHTETDCNHYHAGNYYNQTAAFAKNDTSDLTDSYDMAPDSVCPAGWRLPTARTRYVEQETYDYGTLLAGNGVKANWSGSSAYTTDGFTIIRSVPLYFVRAGQVTNSGSRSNLGSYGYYWSRSAYQSGDAYHFQFYSSKFSEAYGSSAKGTGKTVRCFLRDEDNFFPDEPAVKYGWIQDFALSTCQSIASAESVIVTDRRDDQDYTVKYINGACWMMRELSIQGTVTSAYSNFPSGSVDLSTSYTVGDSYTEPRTHFLTSKECKNSMWFYGKRDICPGYYNYCAASGGTVCAQGAADTGYDLCPSGWRMPSAAEWTASVPYISELDLMSTGNFGNKNFYASGGAWYWSANGSGNGTTFDRNALYSNGSNSEIESHVGNHGSYVRCIRTT